MKLLTFPSELQAFKPRSPHAAQGVMSNPLDKTLLDTAAPRIQNRCFRQAGVLCSTGRWSKQREGNAPTR